MEGEKYIQIGVIAARDPSGNFLPAVPIYVEATPELEQAEEHQIMEIGAVFAAKMKQYIDAGKRIGKHPAKKRKDETE